MTARTRAGLSVLGSKATTVRPVPSNAMDSPLAARDLVRGAHDAKADLAEAVFLVFPKVGRLVAG
jgi:hypothetical protein